MVPPPAYQEGAYQMDQHVVNEVLPEVIPEIAKEAGLSETHVIDIFNVLGGKDLKQWQFFCDSQRCDAVHPNDAGYNRLAAKVYRDVFLDPKTPPFFSNYHELASQFDQAEPNCHKSFRMAAYCYMRSHFL